jgi:outer membrane protein assembly factor BamB
LKGLSIERRTVMRVAAGHKVIGLVGALMVLVSFVPATASASPGHRDWVRHLKGTAYAMGVGSEGTRVYVGGNRVGITSGNDFATDAYDAASGAKLWARGYNGPGNGNDYAFALGVSPDGARVYVTGRSKGVGTGNADFATVAVDAATGNRIWARRYTGPRSDYAYALGVSPDGARVYVTGYTDRLTTSLDYATIAYDAATGTRIWIRRYNQSRGSDDVALALAVSPNGARVYVTGESATVAYDAATGNTEWIRPYGSGTGVAQDIRVSPDGARVYVTGGEGLTVSYDAATGHKIWSNELGACEDTHALGVSPDGTRVYVTGEANGCSTQDYVTVAYDAVTGTELWVQTYSRVRSGFDAAYALGISPDGAAVYVTGESSGKTSTQDYATVAYDSASGTELWARRYDDAQGRWDYAYALGVSPDGGHVYVTGDSSGSATTVAYETG